MSTKVSVILPVYNTANYLKQCLDSLLAQTLPDIEIICVDDGSTDQSLSILEDYAGKDSRIQILRQQNSFAGVARNNGLKTASGKYVLFLDSDDFFEPDMAERLYQRAEETSADVCVCDGSIYLHDTDTHTYPHHYLNGELLPEKEVFNCQDIPEHIFQFTSPAPWNKLFLREFVEKHELRFQPLKKSNDVFFVYLALACAGRISTLPDRLVHYRIGNTGSLQASYASASEYYFYDALMGLRRELIRRKLFPALEKSFVNRALSTCLYHLDKITSFAAFSELIDQYKTKLLYDLGIVGHTSGYFLVKSNFYRVLRILDSTPEELWNASHPIPRTRPNAFELSSWTPVPETAPYEGIKVSVIIPVYNVDLYLDQALDSIQNQTLRQIEILCIDNGSTDRSPEILKAHAQADPRIQIIRKENGGASSARNMGIARAAGKYIYFMDSDDILESKVLEFCFQEMEQKNLDMLLFSARSFFENEDLASTQQTYKNYYERFADYSGITNGKDFYVKAISESEFKPSICLYVLRSSLLRTNNITYREGIVCEDNLFTVQCLLAAERLRFVNGHFYNRRVRENSVMTGTASVRYAYSSYIVIKGLQKLYESEEHPLPKDCRLALLHQIKNLRDKACSLLSDTSPEALLEETIDWPDGADFYFYIGETLKLKWIIRQAQRQRDDEKIRRYKLDYELAKEKERIQKLERKRAKLKKEVKSLTAENQKLKGSLLYKLYRAVTFLPRKIKKHLAKH